MKALSLLAMVLSAMISRAESINFDDGQPSEGPAGWTATITGQGKPLEIVGRSGGYGLNQRVAAGQWHTLRVEFSGARFKVSFDGKALFEVEDSTFSEAGRVDLWTKADSVTEFDDFEFDDFSWGGK
jgi:hypothetical protein